MILIALMAFHEIIEKRPDKKKKIWFHLSHQIIPKRAALTLFHGINELSRKQNVSAVSRENVNNKKGLIAADFKKRHFQL